jgi:hypothetical protein
VKASPLSAASFIKAVFATGVPPDDAIFPTASHGSFYVADTGANPVYAITASGVVPNTSLYADVGDAFNSVNTSTGVVTPILTGVSPHGMDFVV